NIQAEPSGFLSAREGPLCAGRLSEVSEILAILDESGQRADFVIERAGRRIGFVGVPIDPRGPGLGGKAIHLGDQSGADALAARLLGGEEVLQIAIRAD